MMNELPLRDIHLPEPVSWWPPAPGWWLLLVLLILFLLLMPRLLRWLKHKPLNKIAQSEFNRVKQDYQQHQNPQRLLREVSMLLRRTAMSYSSRQCSAGLTGEQWLQHLNSMTEENYFSPEQQQTLCYGPYTTTVEFHVEHLLQACDNWFRHLPKQASVTTERVR